MMETLTALKARYYDFESYKLARYIYNLDPGNYEIVLAETSLNPAAHWFAKHKFSGRSIDASGNYINLETLLRAKDENTDYTVRTLRIEEASSLMQLYYTDLNVGVVAFPAGWREETLKLIESSSLFSADEEVSLNGLLQSVKHLPKRAAAGAKKLVSGHKLVSSGFIDAYDWDMSAHEVFTLSTQKTVPAEILLNDSRVIPRLRAVRLAAMIGKESWVKKAERFRLGSNAGQKIADAAEGGVLNIPALKVLLSSPLTDDATLHYLAERTDIRRLLQEISKHPNITDGTKLFVDSKANTI